MDYKTYRKYSSTLVASEFRSFGRNKMEDRKLALHNDGVNKNKEKRRKSFVSERDQINKHFQENVSKTTPSLEQYLKRSQPKYNAWKLREQERLDRRYRGLYKSYLKEYSDLKLDESIAGLTGIRKLSTASDISDEHVGKSDITYSEQQSSPAVYRAESGATLDQIDGAENPALASDKDEELDKILAIGNISLSNKQNQTSSVSDSTCNTILDDDNRRFSTGGIIFQEEKKMRGLRAGKLDDMDTIKSTVVESSEAELPGEKGTSNGSQADMKDAAGETSSKAEKKKKTRRGSLPPKMPNSIVPMGKRLDRRSSLANVNIAVKYGN